MIEFYTSISFLPLFVLRVLSCLLRIYNNFSSSDSPPLFAQMPVHLKVADRTQPIFGRQFYSASVALDAAPLTRLVMVTFAEPAVPQAHRHHRGGQRRPHLSRGAAPGGLTSQSWPSPPVCIYGWVASIQ